MYGTLRGGYRVRLRAEAVARDRRVNVRLEGGGRRLYVPGLVVGRTLRYRVRLERVAGSLVEDLDKDTVDFQPNYDNSEREPVVMPARFPNLLVNGSQGIAVAMATNIPPHNLGEVIDATVHLNIERQ